MTKFMQSSGLDGVDMFLMFLTVVMLVCYTTSYFCGIGDMKDFAQWFITLLGVFIAKKSPQNMNTKGDGTNG